MLCNTLIRETLLIIILEILHLLVVPPNGTEAGGLTMLQSSFKLFVYFSFTFSPF